MSLNARIVGLDTDETGPSFLNYALFNYCFRQPIMFTRSVQLPKAKPHALP